jgi:hypothetical protein
MTKKEIRKLATSKIQEGKTRQQVFEEIKEETKQASENISIMIDIE